MKNNIQNERIIYPIQKCHHCSQKKQSILPAIVTSNDGNKTQKCLGCGWIWKAPN